VEFSSDKHPHCGGEKRINRDEKKKKVPERAILFNTLVTPWQEAAKKRDKSKRMQARKYGAYTLKKRKEQFEPKKNPFHRLDRRQGKPADPEGLADWQERRKFTG